jgi:hypothetical protein
LEKKLRQSFLASSVCVISCLFYQDMSAATVSDIQQYLALYGQSILLILGNVGNLFATMIFARKTVRQAANLCVLYLLADSISNCIVMNIILISNLYAVGHLDPQNQFDAVCKARWYSTHALLILSRSFSKFYLSNR